MSEILCVNTLNIMCTSFETKYVHRTLEITYSRKENQERTKLLQIGRKRKNLKRR